MASVCCRTWILLSTPLLFLFTTGQNYPPSAPSDTDPFCDQLPGRGQYASGEKVLLDTQNYRNRTLLGESGEDGRWINVGPDSNTSGKWRDSNVDGNCQHSLSLCWVDASSTDNFWLITQYINISLTDITQLMINITYTSSNNSGCIATNTTDHCSGTLHIRTYEANFIDEIGRSMKSSFTNELVGITYFSEGNDDVVSTNKSIPLSGSYTGLYVALSADNACISISRLVLFYYSCPAQVVQGTIYPETVAPVGSTSSIMTPGMCVTFASTGPNLMSVQQPNLECGALGQWTDQQPCRCIKGYFPFEDICIGCLANSYKPTWGNYGCESCPANSASDPGRKSCECLEGFYRTSPVIEGSNCTSPPSAPLNLVTKIILSDTITVDWDAPTDLGGSEEIQYTVILNNTRSGESKVVDRITVTDYTFLDLIPVTRYLISVVALNDASLVADNLTASTATISVTTLPTVTSAPLHVKVVINDSLVQLIWTEPEFIKGELTHYQVLVSLVNDTNEAATFMTEHTYFNLAMFEDTGELYYLWVLATGTFGAGELSEAVTYASSGSGLHVGVILAICAAALIAVLITAIVILGILLILVKKKSLKKGRSVNGDRGNRYSQTPPIPLSDSRPNFLHGGTHKSHISSLYESIAPVYQDIKESLDGLYHYARRDSEIQNIILQIKSNKSKQEAVYFGKSPVDTSRNSDKECTRQDDSDEDDGYVCGLTRVTKDRSDSYVTVTP